MATTGSEDIMAMPIGFKHSEESKQKMRELALGRTVSDETKTKLSRIHKKKRYSTRTEFKTGAPPPKHKENCECFRCLCSGNIYSKSENKRRKWITNPHRAWLIKKLFKNALPIPKFIKKMTPSQKLKIKNASISRRAGQILIVSGERTRFKKGQIAWNKGKPHDKVRGNQHWNWQGGLTELNFKIRNSLEYKIWRESVIKRDNYCCSWCNGKDNLEVDHITPFASILKDNKIKSLQEAQSCHSFWDLNNGRTLCNNCHKTTESYLNQWRVVESVN